MIKSMTGYGKASFKNDELSINMEIKTVNHRFLDISIRMPSAFLEYEDTIRKVIRSSIKRGKVDVFVTVESTSLFEKNLLVDYQLLEKYIDVLQTIKQKHNIDSAISLDHVLRLPDIITIVEKENETHSLEMIFADTCKEAISKLIAMRKKEGELLKQKIMQNLNNLTACLNELQSRYKEFEPTHFKRLRQRISEIVENKIDIDESRILMEAAILAEKANIQEEITRLESHCLQFQSVLEEEGAVGRKLDFIVQEMNREINTIGSKSGDFTINQYVVNMKSELEMIREQIQNIE